MAEEQEQQQAPKKYYAKDFEWGDHLGEGTFGAVQKVKHIESGEEKACKILSKAQITKEKKIKYVKTERDILLKCKSPYIVSLFCTFSDPDHLYYVLELCPNGELFHHLRKYSSFDASIVSFYAAEIVCAVEHLHEKNIIHRDLKPENVLLSGDMHVKLTDFGTAKILDAAEEGSETEKGISRSQSFVGTAEYVSPELLIDKYCCLASDLWSLGAIVFQLMTGRMAFHGATQFLTFQKIEKGDLEWPTNVDEFPKDCQDFIKKLLVVDPTKRLGAPPDGFAPLKKHPFFENIEWEDLYSKTPPALETGRKFRFKADEEREKDEARKKAEEEGTAKWKKHLNQGETVFTYGLVVKKRGMSTKKRQLILTNTPRLIYVDPKKDQTMGEVPWVDEMTFQVNSSKDFIVGTPNRKYIFTSIDKTAAEWETAIMEKKKKG
eukprot:CAMPEP_0201480474 /NCGR_PEP_ID=MMETSP0151_2-20130828/4952_1 /ASSEMBLY_ACC=CAM_ASM_000257 /TAXON_ID=200890 /ORGANISM="Paramoeba atlantica, Strain 621/1 / CCAP 1560/9" /LENGTH=434 /DNA_ID=CAMNT_0047862337 /DNA_START=167 /DNA_END=1471 /DNA_ORIENTATION=+